MTPISVASAAAPPLFLRLSGPRRWRLLAELVRSDRQVRELGRSIDERQSLTSYHLGPAPRRGLVTCGAAGRPPCAYYSLDLAACRERLAEAVGALHPGLRSSPPPVSGGAAGDGLPTSCGEPASCAVLFLSPGTVSFADGRGSRAASSVAAKLTPQRGSHPKGLHPGAVQVMGERGIDIGGRRSKPLSEFTSQRFDS